MRVAVFESSSPLGVCLVEELAAKGFNVVACLRNTSNVQFSIRDRIKVHRCDIFSAESIQVGLKDCDAVISCIAWRSDTPITIRTSLYSDATRALLLAMQKSSVKQIIATSSWGTKSLLDKWDRTYEPPCGLYFKQCVVKPNNQRASIDDFDLLEVCIRNSLLTYTIVRAPFLTDNRFKLAKKTRLFVEENKSYVHMGEKLMSNKQLTRFIIKSLQDKEYHNKVLAVGYIKIKHMTDELF